MTYKPKNSYLFCCYCFYCFHSYILRQLALKVTCSIIVMSSVERDDKLRKCKITKKSVLKFHFVCQKARAVAVSLFFYFCADQSLFVRSIITAQLMMCVWKEIGWAKRKLSRIRFFFLLLFARSFQFNWMNNWHIN